MEVEAFERYLTCHLATFIVGSLEKKQCLDSMVGKKPLCIADPHHHTANKDS